MTKHPQIKTEGDSIVLLFPSRRGEELTHSTTFPNTDKGITQLLRVLKSIECHKDGETFATEPEPIQHMVDQWLKENKVTRKIRPELDPLVEVAKEFCPPKEDHLVFLKDNRAVLEKELARRNEFNASFDFDLEELI